MEFAYEIVSWICKGVRRKYLVSQRGTEISPWDMGNFLISWWSLIFSSRDLFHGFI